MQLPYLPPGGCARPLGVLFAIDVCLNGELISILSLPAAPVLPLAGDERKNSGEEDAIFCREARGVSCK